MEKKRVKIALLSFYSGVVFRGVETFVHELANNLTELGNDVTVFQIGSPLASAKYKTCEIKLDVNWDYKRSQMPFVNYFSKKIKEFTFLSLNEVDKDTNVILPTNGQWQSILCKWWAVKNKKTIIISGQSGLGIDDRVNLFSFPDTFVALTNYQRRWANGANPFVKIESIPNGVDIEKFKPKGKSLNIDLPRPIILSVSALVGWKRIDLAIKAVSRLNKGSLLVIGKAEESKVEKELKDIAKEYLPGRHQFASFSHEIMPEVYRSADVFTFSTVPWESFGIVILEALATNIPVVTSDDPIRREIVGKAGLFVDPEDTQAYSKTLEDALSTDWGNIPRKRAENFTWHKVAIKYEKLFNRLIQ